jgi:hypothetical protein
VVTSRATKRITAASLPKLYKTPGYHHDGGGLYLQVTANGGKSWVFRYMLDKRAREMGLGSADLWDLTTIRAKVLELKRLLHDGIDPITARDNERRQRQQAAAMARTFEECAVEYHRLNESKWKNAKHANQFINTLRTYAFPTFGSWPVASAAMRSALAVVSTWVCRPSSAARTSSTRSAGVEPTNANSRACFQTAAKGPWVARVSRSARARGYPFSSISAVQSA